MKLLKFALTSPVMAMSVALCAALSSFAADVTIDDSQSIEDGIVAVGESGTLTLKKGTYVIRDKAELLLDKAITIVGETGDPKDVIVTRNSADDAAKIGYRIFHLTNAGAKIKDLTVSGGKFLTNDSTGTAWKSDQNGVNVSVDDGTVEHCILENANTTSDAKNNRGLGFYLAKGRITRCIIRNNTNNYSNNNRYAAGGMIGGAGQVDNCLFCGNTSAYGILYINGACKVYNCTFVDNVTAGVLIHRAGGICEIRNCLIGDNVSYKSPQSLVSVININMAYLMNGCMAEYFIYEKGTTVNPVGAFTFKDAANGDYRPVAGSACIDNASAVDVGWTASDLDLAGNPRVGNGRADIGCYEWTAATAGEEVGVSAAVYSSAAPYAATISASVSGLTPVSCTFSFGDGSDPVTTTALSASHTFAKPGVYELGLSLTDSDGKVHVATGKVVATGDTVELSDGADVNAALDAVSTGGKLVLDKGTYSVDHTVCLTRGITVCGDPSYKRGDIVVTRPANTSKADPYQIFYLYDSLAVVENLTSDGGSTVGSKVDAYGAGVVIGAAGGTLRNCIVRNADGAYSNNRCGGVYCESADGLIDRCVITNNQSSATSGNSGGGGVYMTKGTMKNSLVAYNKAKKGSVYLNNDTINLYNCTIAGNTSSEVAGIVIGGTKPKIVNCIVAGNTGSTAANGVYNSLDNAKAAMTYCVVDSGVADAGGTNITGTPDWKDDLYHTYQNSCNVNKGDNTVTAFTADDTDLDGNPRLDAEGDGIDIGCYEYTVEAGKVTVTMVAKATAGVTPFNAEFSAIVEGADGKTLTYCWDFGDGNTDETSEPKVTYAYETPGVFTATLVVKEGAKEYPAVNEFTITVQLGTVVYDGKTMTLAEAYALVGDNGTIVFKPDTYDFTEEFIVTRPVTFRSETGRPEDVVIRRDPESECRRLFTLNNAGAALKDLTIEGGLLDGSEKYGANVLIAGDGGTVDHCIVRNGRCEGGSNNRCGGVCCQSAAGVISRCVLSNNYCASYSYTGGAGAYLSAGRIENSLVVFNSGKSGSLYVDGSAKVYNCTVAKNTSKDNTAGILFASKDVKVVNTIVSDNVGKSATDAVYGLYNVSLDKILPCFVNCVTPLDLNSTCIVGQPDFKSAGEGDFHVSKTSCNNGVGDNSVTGYTADDLDLDGNARIGTDGKLDVGCYQWVLNGLEVSFDVSKTSGILPLEVTLTPNVEGADGVYACLWSFDGGATYAEEPAGAVRKTFMEAGTYDIVFKVVYDGKEYPAPSGKSVRAYPGAITVDPEEGIQAAVDAGGDGTVVTIPAGTYALEARLEILSGLTLRGATGNPKDVVLTRTSGPIVKVNHKDALVTGITVSDTSMGGGDDATTGLGFRLDDNGGTVSNCVVRDIYPHYEVTKPSHYNVPVWIKNGLMTHCKIVNNGNEASGDIRGGGGISAVYMLGGRLEHSLIAGNRGYGEAIPDGEGYASSSGLGVIYLNGASASVLSCTVAGNSAPRCGGIRISENGGSARDCLIAGNEATLPGYSAVYAGSVERFVNCAADTVKINDSCLMGDPCFIAPARGIYRIGGKSVAVDAGSDGVALPAVDVGGRPRLVGKAVDIGCYENQGGFSIFVR